MTLDAPNVARGARFWSYHVKPADDPAYYKSATFDASPVNDDLWSSVGAIWFSPTQVLISLITNTANAELLLEIKGNDQFGYPVEETIEFDAPTTGTYTQGTAKCYVSMTSITVLAATNIGTSDTYKFGIGSDDNDEYRIPIPVRVREEAEVKGVQDVAEGEFYHTGASNLTIDEENEALVVDLGTNETAEKHLAVLLDPARTSI